MINWFKKLRRGKPIEVGGVIYSATNLLNGKRYVGQTIRTMEQRRYEHEMSAMNDSHLPFHKAIRKYGKENFRWGIVQKVPTTQRDLDKAEARYIAVLGTLVPKGYNVLDGNTKYVRGKRNRHRREIYMLDKVTSKVIKLFPSITEACEWLQGNNPNYRARYKRGMSSDIINVAKGKKGHHTAYGHKWRYKEDK